MNNLLLLAGIVLVVCLMNSKDLMKSVSSKSKSVSKSLGADSTTLLIVVFVGAVLFMCMNNGVEGFVPVGKDGNCVTGNKHHVQVVNNETNEPTHKPVPGCFNPGQESALTVSPIINTKPTKPRGPNTDSDTVSTEGGLTEERMAKDGQDIGKSNNSTQLQPTGGLTEERMAKMDNLLGR